MRTLPAAVVLLLAAGCVAPAADVPALERPLVDVTTPPFAQDHDHFDPSLHDAALGARATAYHNLVPGTDGSQASDRGAWLTSEIIVRGTYAYVGYLGAPWLLGVVDLADPAAPRLVGTFATSNALAMDVAVSDDGDWAFVSVYPGAAGTLFGNDFLLQTIGAPSGPALPGIAVVDVRDRTAPKLSSFFPTHGLGPHTASYGRHADGRELLAVNKADAPPGNAIVLTEIVETPTGRALSPLAEFALNGPLDTDFPHDDDFQVHPITGQTLLYVAYWDSGLVILDVSDPAKPTVVSQSRDFPSGEEVQVHDVHPYPALVDGTHYTLTAPEIPTGETSGHLRVWDTTDPAAPVLVGQWILPGGFVVDSPFLFSTHNFQFLPDGRVALAHGHAGVWIVDWLTDPTSPVAEAFLLPSPAGAVAPTWAPVVGAPWFWGTAVDAGGNLWASDVESGLWGIRVTT